MHTETKKTSVLISGVSIASLCLALGLALEEVPVLLIDEKDSRKASSQLVILFPATIAQLRKLDVWSLISEDVQIIT